MDRRNGEGVAQPELVKIKCICTQISIISFINHQQDGRNSHSIPPYLPAAQQFSDLLICGCHAICCIHKKDNYICILHGSHSLGLAAPLQIVGALPNCPWMEIALVTPPLLPWEQWEPVNAILKSPPLYEIEEGYIQIPQKPGLGVELDEEALEEYRI